MRRPGYVLVLLLLVLPLAVPMAPAAAPLTVAEAAEQATTGIMSLPVPGGLVTLHLEPRVLLAPDASVTEVRAEGPVPAPVDAIRTYRGDVAGVPDSWARVTFNGDGFVAGLVVAGDQRWHVEAGPGEAVVARPVGDDHLGHVGDDAVDAPELVGPTGVTDPVPERTRPARIYLVGDHAFHVATRSYQYVHDGPGWAFVMLHNLNVVEGFFDRQIGVTYDVVGMTTYVDGVAPFERGETVTGSAKLRAFRDHYEQVAPQEGRPRDLAHLYSGTESRDAIGTAYVGAVASSYAYGWSRVLGPGPIYAVLVGHEIGHNFDGVHSRAEFYAVPGYGGRTILYPIICHCYEYSRGVIPWYNNEDPMRAYAAARLGAASASAAEE